MKPYQSLMMVTVVVVTAVDATQTAHTKVLLLRILKYQGHRRCRRLPPHNLHTLLPQSHKQKLASYDLHPVTKRIENLKKAIAFNFPSTCIVLNRWLIGSLYLY